MTAEGAPVLVAYDGSELSKAAVRHAAALFAGRPTMVGTVWEPGLTTMATGMTMGAMGMGDSFAGTGIPYDPETTEAVDRSQHEHASRVAEEGAELARSLGLAAEALPVPDKADVADTLIDIAGQRGAAVVVVGSHGITGLRSHIMGSVARKLVEHCDRPVLVIRDDSR